VGGDQRLQLADQLGVPAEGQVGVQALLEGDQAGLLEGWCRGPAQRLGGDVGQRRSPPERQRPAELFGRLASVTGGHGPPAAVGRLPEAVPIELARLDPEQVAARPGQQHRRRPVRLSGPVQRPAQPGHVALEHVAGRRRRCLSPQLVDQPVGRDHPAGVEEESSEHSPRLRAAHVKPPAAVPHLDRPQDPELHLHPKGPIRAGRYQWLPAEFQRTSSGVPDDRVQEAA